MAAVVVVLAGCAGPTADDTASTTTTAPAAATTIPPTTSTTTVPTSAAPSTTSTTLPTLEGLAWEEVADLGDFITGIEPVGDGVLVATKAGFLRTVSPTGEVTTVADLTALVRNQGEQGLLDLALHPEGDRLFVHHSAGNGDTVLAELPYPALDATTTLFRTRQPAANHNGGSIEFGPDGMLYLALGDGGASGDRYGNGQATDTPLGAIHRFDVSEPGVAAAPPDNPGFPIASIWLYGVRNPWRIAFDGDRLLVADVGQNAWEEVTVVRVPAGAGANLGWPRLEATHCFRDGCDPAGTLLPTVEVRHGDAGTCSITGGEVYRGAAIPELGGQYLFSDYCGEYLWSFDVEDGTGGLVEPRRWVVAGLANPAVIAAGADGEVLAGGADGVLRRLVPER